VPSAYTEDMDIFAFYGHRWNWHISPPEIGAIIVLAILVLAFELWMLIDCILSKKVPTTHKVWWIIGMFLIHPIVAIVYFFVSRLHYNKLP